MTRFATAVLPLTVLLLAAGAQAGGEVVEVIIKKFEFRPAELTIPAGTTVRWVNQEKRQYHSVWFQELGEPEPGYFFPEESYERTFDTPGTFPYLCGPHPRMRGVVIVTQ